MSRNTVHDYSMLDAEETALSLGSAELRRLAALTNQEDVLKPLYQLSDGTVVTTHSMITSFRRCPNQARYKYAERLKKKVLTARDAPLRRGMWVHELLEVHYDPDTDETWQERHAKLTAKYNLLFDEEKEALGDLPAECARLMRSYLWHYGADKEDPYHGWNVQATELTLECPWPDGNGIYRCRVDFLFEDEWGLWVGDHKTHKVLPNTGFRIRDAASALYIWCARENGIPVDGFLWNYLRTKAPTTPQLAYAGKPNQRLSTKAIDTDYPTMYRAIKSYGLDVQDYRDQLIALKRQRFKRGDPQTSSFFRWSVLEKDDDMIARVVAAAMQTRDRMHSYDWAATEAVERASDRSCDWCDYGKLCETELFTGDGTIIRRQQYRTGDPLDYYQEQKDSTSD